MLHETVAKLASQQLKMLEEPQKWAAPDASATLLPQGSLDSTALCASPADSIIGNGTSSVGSDAATEGGDCASIMTMTPAPYEGYAAVLAGICAIAMVFLGQEDIPVVF